MVSMASEVFESEPMTREEAKRILRRLELDAYSAIVTAFRAQGDVNKTKKTILNELSNHLSISTERHRAEVRRVVNDDRLNAVAECMHGSGTSTEWSIEGHHLVSLMPRLVPQTVFTAKATAAANQAVESNQKLPIKTEIEVLPLPTKQKSVPPKNDRAVVVKEDSKSSQKPLVSGDVFSSIKGDDQLKKKKRQTIPYSKPSPIALNKSLTNPFKPSTPTLKPIIKGSTLKYSPNYSVSRTTASSPLNTTGKYSPKPIILQKSPTKTQNNIARSSIHLQSLNPSSVSTPLTSLTSLGSNKVEGSLQLIQSPMIKVVSNSLNSSLNSISTVSGLQNNSITQKIKFKTPLPKPKVKATKFKPMVPLQRPGLLSSSQSSDVIGIGISSSVITSSISPNKSTNVMQGMSVKVVQVAKSSIGGSIGSSSLINYSNKPVVVVSSAVKTPPHKVLSFSSISSVASQPMKAGSNLHSSPSVTSSLQKGTLSSKSMPLATGFKMIAVTTVVPGTTQVKTVYIATPIMSLTKTISQTTCSSITTPVQNKHTSLASNLQSVVARSMNAAIMNQTGKYHGMQNMLRATTIASSITTPTFAIGKASQVTSSMVKGLGSLRTTLSGTVQSLKVFTAVSKNRSPLCVNSSARNTPSLTSSNMLTSNQQNQQHIGNIQVKNIDTSNTKKKEKQHVINVSHHNVYTTTSSGYSSTNTVASNNISEQENSPVSLETTLALSGNNYDDAGTTLNVLSDESVITTEQITASAIAETDDMAFLNAGEKFLEQLSAKMTANSPDSLTKNESFIFPGNISLDMSDERPIFNQTLYELNKSKCFGVACPSSDLTNANVIDDKIISNKINLSQSKLSTVPKKESNYLLNPKGGGHNIGIVSSKISSKLLNNNLCFMNTKLNTTSTPNTIPAEVIHKSIAQVSSFTSPSAVPLCRTGLQNKADLTARTVLSYPSMSRDCTKLDNSKDSVQHHTSQGNTSAYDDTVPSLSTGLNTKLSPNASNKLHVSIPGNPKLNISPFRGSNGSLDTIHSSNINLFSNSELFTPIKSNVNNTLFSMNNLQKNTISIEAVSSNTNDDNSLLFSSIKQTLTVQSESLNSNITGSGAGELSLGKKRKLCEVVVPARTQASWIRGAANLLARVSRFRGTNKQKGEMNAASWFTKPVDPSDAPGYYRIIRNPMDFGKIRRKLEDGEYNSYPNFYDDMMLIKKNCYSYNPVGHIARKDCDDVFAFFEGEYQKLLERWEKHHVSPHKKIKICADENGNST